MENIEVAKFMLLKRGFERGSVIAGSSVHNQWIERLWRDVFQGVIYKLFHGLESLGLLDQFNQIHLYALYIPNVYRPCYKVGISMVYPMKEICHLCKCL